MGKKIASKPLSKQSVVFNMYKISVSLSFLGRNTGSMGCFTCRNFARCSAFTVLALAVIIGLFVVGVPTQLGLFRWFAHRDVSIESRSLIGLAPAFMLPDEYRYTFEDVARTDLTGQTAVVTGVNCGLRYWP